MKRKNIIVVGGGASGLMAAGVAAEGGAEVLLLEKMKTPARKIRISGKGRCNVTNSAELSDFISHFGKSGRFLRQSFSRFFSSELISFFESKGLALQVERGGRIFPAQKDAPAVARLLVNWVEDKGVVIKAESKVTKLLVAGDKISGVVCNNKHTHADAVIVATGGASYPRTGSTGDGYRMLRRVGHSLIPIRPALVPLETNKESVRGLAGLDLRNINARLYVDGKRKKQEFGELIFTRSGLGGPVILTMSSIAVDALRGNRKVEISLDLKPALDDGKLDARLRRDLEKRHLESMDSVLRGLVPRELVATCLSSTGIDPGVCAGQLSAKARTQLRIWLKDFRFDIIGFRSIDDAIITAGGIETRDIDPYTMESKIIRGLYVVGELLDIQADTGGYNLQAAFSTGWMAGKAVIHMLENG